MSTLHDVLLVLAGAVAGVPLALLAHSWESGRARAEFQRDLLVRLISSLAELQFHASDAAIPGGDEAARDAAVVSLRGDIARVDELGLQVRDTKIRLEAKALAENVIRTRARGSRPAELLELVPSCDALKDMVGGLLRDWPSKSPRLWSSRGRARRE